MSDTVKVYMHRARSFRRADQNTPTWYGPGPVTLPADVARLMGYDVPNQPRSVIAGAVAIALANAGFDTPEKIKAATDEQLRELPGVGPKALESIRMRYGQE